MAKKQTRRSISFSRADFEAAQAAAERAEIPLAQLAATALREYIERLPKAPAKARVKPRTAAAPEIALPAAKPTIDDLIDRSSVGAGLRNIRENGIEAEIEDLADEMHAADDDVALDEAWADHEAAVARERDGSASELQVVYDDDHVGT